MHACSIANFPLIELYFIIQSFFITEKQFARRLLKKPLKELESLCLFSLRTDNRYNRWIL